LIRRHGAPGLSIVHIPHIQLAVQAGHVDRGTAQDALFLLFQKSAKFRPIRESNHSQFPRIALSTDFVITGFINFLKAFLPALPIFSSGDCAIAADSQSHSVLRVALGGRNAIADLTRPPFEFPAVVDRVLLPEFLRRLKAC
jgi:hypothetical protein